MKKLIALLLLMLSFNAVAEGMIVTWHSSPVLAAANRAPAKMRQVIYDVNRVIHKYENDGYRVVDLDVPGVEKPSDVKDITKELADAAGLNIQE